ncbi:hypothetical protein BBK82_31885 [Lentzea guizhouensis]|uniref:Uncharacterized protein n=1 Tax=Lentzea guizhouensis TaxID=1586287 RepID=A0A1B2HQF7_9PSEU|nr:hypothetical protein BBK82_31885 [Lentzea guizhouensis]
MVTGGGVGAGTSLTGGTSGGFAPAVPVFPPPVSGGLVAGGVSTSGGFCTGGVSPAGGLPPPAPPPPPLTSGGFCTGGASPLGGFGPLPEPPVGVGASVVGPLTGGGAGTSAEPPPLPNRPASSDSLTSASPRSSADFADDDITDFSLVTWFMIRETACTAVATATPTNATIEAPKVMGARPAAMSAPPIRLPITMAMMSRTSERTAVTHAPMVAMSFAEEWIDEPIASISLATCAIEARKLSAVWPIQPSSFFSASRWAVAMPSYCLASSLTFSVSWRMAMLSPTSRSRGSRRKAMWSISQPTPAPMTAPSGFSAAPTTSNARPTLYAAMAALSLSSTAFLRPMIVSSMPAPENLSLNSVPSPKPGVQVRPCTIMRLR